MVWHRVRSGDKTAWREDLQEDTTLTDLQKRMISVIAKHWDNGTMSAECSGSFIAVGAGTTEKMVKKYKQTLIDSGRVSIVRPATYTTSTLWDVNWWFRGSAYIRHTNGGEPIIDCRKVVPNTAHGGSPDVPGGGPQACMGGGPQAGTQFLSIDRDRGAPRGARPDGRAHGRHKEKKENPHRAAPGYSKWKIVHAEYAGKEDETFVAHLRSGRNRKYVLRCHVDSDDYESVDEALTIDGEPSQIIGNMVQMSTNRSGAKSFMRAAPMPWTSATILAGESTETGVALRVLIEGEEVTLRLAHAEAENLASACGGEEAAIGATVRYRLLPDDMMEFQKVAAWTPSEHGAASANGGSPAGDAAGD